MATALARWLQQNLQDRQLTLQAAAVRASVSTATISDMINHDQIPRLEILFRLADYFGTSREQILPGPDHRAPGQPAAADRNRSAPPRRRGPAPPPANIRSSPMKDNTPKRRTPLDCRVTPSPSSSAAFDVNPCFRVITGSERISRNPSAYTVVKRRLVKVRGVVKTG